MTEVDDVRSGIVTNIALVLNLGTREDWRLK